MTNMKQHLGRIATGMGATVLLGISLTACAGQGGVNHSNPNAATTPKASAEAASHTPSTPDTQAPPTGTAQAGSTSLRSERCSTPNLAATVASADNSSGHTGISIVLRNVGKTPCTLQGWPGLSLVGSGHGKQIGAAAGFDKTSPHGTVTLAAGGTAHAAAEVARASDFNPASCKPTVADGFRIYPPGEKRALFAKDAAFHGCANVAVKLLTVQALQPGR